MRVIRGAILAIVATLGLALGIASTAYADDGRSTATTNWSPSPTNVSPGDPGIPE